MIQGGNTTPRPVRTSGSGPNLSPISQYGTNGSSALSPQPVPNNVINGPWVQPNLSVVPNPTSAAGATAAGTSATTVPLTFMPDTPNTVVVPGDIEISPGGPPSEVPWLTSPGDGATETLTPETAPLLDPFRITPGRDARWGR